MQILKEGVVDLIVIYQLVKKLSTPFNKTDAFKLGIIDEKGKILKKRKTLKTAEEKSAYNIFDTLVWNLKKLLSKIPGGSSKLASYAAAFFLLKEESNNRYVLQEKLSFEDNMLVNCLNLEQKFKSFFNFHKEEIYKLMEETPAVAVDKVGTLTDEPPKKKKKKRDKFAGADVFECDMGTMMHCRFGKESRYHRWSRYVGAEEMGEEIRTYARANPKSPIILKDPKTGAMMYLRHGAK